MYCVKCGAELADSERKCPLCMTPVYYPGHEGGDALYPATKPKEEKLSLKGLNFVICFAFLLAATISLIADLDTGERGLSWCWLVLGGLGVAYVVFFLPLWFVRRSPAVFVPADFVAIGLYVWLVSAMTGGGWYVTLGLPVVGAAALIFSSVTILAYYLKCGYLYIAGGASIALGLMSVMIEWLIHVTFDMPAHHYWSIYPAIAFGLVGIMLTVIAIVKPLRESLARVFAL